jgi:hypothetical protein
MTAVNALGPGLYSDVVYLDCATKPAAAVAAPTAEATTKSSITVAWAAPADTGGTPVTGYRVYMNALSVGDWTLVYQGTGYPTRAVYPATGLSEGEAYRFKVAALNSVGAGADSPEATFFAADFPGGPSQPVLNAPSTTGQVSFSWLPPADNGGLSLTAYEVWHKLTTQAEADWTRIHTTPDALTLLYVHTVTAANADVQYRVRATTAKGPGPYSVRSTFVLAAPPTVTAAPLRVDSSRSSITVSWQLAADGGSPITGYRLYQTPVLTGTEVLIYDGSGLPTVSSTKVTGLTEGSIYRYRASAINRAGEGAKSPVSALLAAA